jgi:hypothetical protein
MLVCWELVRQEPPSRRFDYTIIASRRASAAPRSAGSVGDVSSAGASRGPPAGARSSPVGKVALADRIEVVTLAGAAIIVVGTATSLALARGRRTGSVAMPAPEPVPAS